MEPDNTVITGDATGVNQDIYRVDAGRRETGNCRDMRTFKNLRLRGVPQKHTRKVLFSYLHSFVMISKISYAYTLGVVKVGRYNIFHRSCFFVTIMRWQKTSVLANRSSPTLITPKCIIS